MGVGLVFARWRGGAPYWTAARPRRAGAPASRSWGVMPGFPAAWSPGPRSFQPVGPATPGQPDSLAGWPRQGESLRASPARDCGFEQWTARHIEVTFARPAPKH